jgi:hypothetical protein
MLMADAWGLLHITLSQGRPCVLWLWVRARSAPDRWLPLRRALTRHAG